MTTKRAFLITLGIVAIVLVSMKTLSKQTEGPHGGRIQTVGKYAIETKAVFPHLYAYLLSDKNIPINNKGITCDADLFFYPNEHTSVSLKPEGIDGFITETNISGYYSYRITFQAFGETITTKFENENIQVKAK